MSASRYSYWAALGILLMCVPVSMAQQQNQENQDSSQSPDQSQSQDQTQPQDQSQAPIPAYRSPFGSVTGNDNSNASPQDLTPDTQPLAGAQVLSLGSPEQRSYWQLHADVNSTATSNGLGAVGGWTTYTTFLGGINLHAFARHSNLGLSYVGGGLVSNDGGTSNGITQELSLSETLSWQRVTVSFFNQGSYLPQTGFGYGGMGGLALPGAPTQLQPGLTPAGTILTTRGQQLANSSFGEINFKISPQSSFTFLGGYSLLHFFENDLLNTNNAVFQAGYNREITRKNTIALLYRFNAFRYSSGGQALNDNIAHVSFARRVTGRLAFQISAGPEVTFVSTPGSPASSALAVRQPHLPLQSLGTSSATSGTIVNWSLGTSLTYQLERTGLGLSYFHGVNGGSGVLAGAIGDTVTASLSRPLSRSWGSSFSAGYARNTALAIPGFETFSQSYNYWFGRATLNHSWTRTLNLFLSYQMNYQDSNSAFCAGPTCGTNVIINSVSVGLDWLPRPNLF